MVTWLCPFWNGWLVHTHLNLAFFANILLVFRLFHCRRRKRSQLATGGFVLDMPHVKMCTAHCSGCCLRVATCCNVLSQFTWWTLHADLATIRRFVRVMRFIFLMTAASLAHVGTRMGSWFMNHNILLLAPRMPANNRHEDMYMHINRTYEYENRVDTKKIVYSLYKSLYMFLMNI